MARDYNAKRVIKRNNNPIGRLFSIMVAFVSGYFSATIFDITSLSQWLSNPLNTQEKPKTVAAAQTHEGPKPKFEFYTILAKGSPKRSEYDAIQKEMSKKVDEIATLADKGNPHAPQVTPPVTPGIAPTGLPASVASVKPLTPNPAAPIISTQDNPRLLSSPTLYDDKNERYTVQIAAFRNRADAEKMRANLAAKGYITQVALVNQPGGLWYRVMMGPFSTKNDAIKAQGNIARTERINGMLRKA